MILNKIKKTWDIFWKLLKYEYKLSYNAKEATCNKMVKIRTTKNLTVKNKQRSKHDVFKVAKEHESMTKCMILTAVLQKLKK